MRTTSLEAYKHLVDSGTLSQRRWEAFQILFVYGPATGNEVAAHGCRPGLWKRLSELARLGLVREVGTKKCSITGEEVTAWDVNEEWHNLN